MLNSFCEGESKQMRFLCNLPKVNSQLANSCRRRSASQSSLIMVNVETPLTLAKNENVMTPSNDTIIKT